MCLCNYPINSIEDSCKSYNALICANSRRVWPKQKRKTNSQSSQILHLNVNDSARGGKELQVSERGRYEAMCLIPATTIIVIIMIIIQR